MRRLFVFVATAALGVGTALGSGAHPALADTGATSTPTPGTGTASASAIVATAEQYLGYPYAYIGDDPSTGFSCIGFVHFVFAQHGVYVPEDLSKAYASAPQVAPADLQPGDLVFFQNTVWTGLSHVDLYVGGGKMIGADTFQTGVQWDALSDPYWQQHYLGATRPLSNPTGTPVNPSATPVPSGPSLAPTPTPGPGLSIKAGTIVTASHSASVYSGPGDTYTEIDTVTPTMQLTVVQTEGQWANVSYDGGNQYGWVHGPDLNLQGAAASGDSSGSDSSGNTGASGGNGSGANGSGSANVGSQSVTTTAQAGATLTVQSAALTVYTEPSAGGMVLASLTAGTDVTVLQTVKQWDQVTLPDGTVGWVDGSGLTPATSQDTSASGGTGQYSSTPRARVQQVKGFHATRAARAPSRQATVTADVLFVRAGPSTHTRILRRVHAGDRLHILRKKHGWDYVSLRDGNRGWVSAHWIKVAKRAA